MGALVMVLPWLHHVHCSLQCDIIWLEQELWLQLQSNRKNKSLRMKRLTPSIASNATFAFEGYSLVQHVFLQVKISQILLALGSSIWQEQPAQAQK